MTLSRRTEWVLVSGNKSASNGLCRFISSGDGDSIYLVGLCDIKLVAVWILPGTVVSVQRSWLYYVVFFLTL